MNSIHNMKEFNVLELMYSLGWYTRSVQNKLLFWKRKEVFIYECSRLMRYLLSSEMKSIDFICIDQDWAQFGNM